MVISQLVIQRSFRKHELFLHFVLSAKKKLVFKVSVMTQMIKKYIFLSGAHFTLITFQMYSSSLRFLQNEPKNHSNGMSGQKNAKEDQT